MKNASVKPAPKSQFLSSLDDIQNACSQPVKVYFEINGKNCELLTRHLTPYESELLKLQLDELVAPIIKGKTEAEDRIDFSNVPYIQKKTKVERCVRAQAIFWTTEAFQKNKPELVDGKYTPANRQPIADFVQGMLTEDVLDLIYVAIVSPKLNAVDPEKINFISPGG